MKINSTENGLNCSTGYVTKWRSDDTVSIDDTFTHTKPARISLTLASTTTTQSTATSGAKISSTYSTPTKNNQSLGFRLYEKHDKRCVELAIELVDEYIWICISADTYLFYILYCSEWFVTRLEDYRKQWVSAVRSDTHVMDGGERICVDALSRRVDTIPRTIDGETYHIWTQNHEVGRLGAEKLLIPKKELATKTNPTNRA